MLQASPATLGDFDGHEGCNEILNLTRPDIVRSIHDAYLEAGVDCITTNTFGANLGNLGEYGLQSRIEELSEAGARIARAAADAASTGSRPRWVLGSVGPGTKLPTLGHVRFADLRDAYQRNAAGLLRGGVDAIVVETCQDLLQAKAAIIGARRAMAADAGDIPLIAHVTIETTGSMLLGTRDRRRAHRPGAARHQPDRAQLRHRPGGDERAPALPGGPRSGPGFLHAQRRPAGAHGRRRPLPADPRPARRRPRDVHRRVRARTGGRVLRHHPRAPGRAGGPRVGQAAHSPAAAARARGRLALPACAVPPGHLVPRHRRAHQRQRVEGVPRGAAGRPARGLRRDRPAADPRRGAPARRVRGLRGPGRPRRHDRGGRRSPPPPPCRW